MAVHKLLLRQLNRLGLNPDELPNDIEQWQTFLNHVSNCYSDSDDERYLLERSMNISSGELSELNKLLENSQKIAKLGYWVYDSSSNIINLSKEFVTLLGLSEEKHNYDYGKFIEFISKHDVMQFDASLKNALANSNKYECEIRFIRPDKKERWFHIIGRPMLNIKEQFTGIAMDITDRKIAEAEISNLHKQLLTSARRAGMSDVATAILHNVGNILNSANVSVSLIKEKIEKAHYDKFFIAIKMLIDHLPNLTEYLLQDEKGKLLPHYFSEVSAVIQEDQKSYKKEVENLSKQLQYIKDIVSMQKAISGVSGIIEKIFLPETIDAALEVSESTFEKTNITIIKNYEFTPFIITDKSKLLQIFMNLIQNAKDSHMTLLNDREKEINISIKNTNQEHQVQIIIEDNGIGIEKSNINKIFSFGFTTKPNGHGFGLHSSAIAAREIGGSLRAESKGLGQGAKFTLTLPLKLEKTNEAND